MSTWVFWGVWGVGKLFALLSVFAFVSLKMRIPIQEASKKKIVRTKKPVTLQRPERQGPPPWEPAEEPEAEGNGYTGIQVHIEPQSLNH